MEVDSWLEAAYEERFISDMDYDDDPANNEYFICPKCGGEDCLDDNGNCEDCANG